MRKTIKPEEYDRRAVFVRQAIARGGGRFFGGAKLLYPVSDYILLGFQKPTCFSIWDRASKLVFSTFRDPHIVSDSMLSTGIHLNSPNRCKIDLSFLGTNLSGYFATLHNVSESGFAPMDTEDIAFLRQILDPNKTPRFPDGFSEALLEAIKANSENQWVDSDCSNAKPLSDEQVAKYLKPLRGVLDEVIAELLEQQSFSVKLSNNASVPNLFAVVRTVRSTRRRFADLHPEGIFPYTASLLLSNAQRDLLPAICEDSGCTTCLDTTRAFCQQKQYSDRCISLLEAPLSSKARSIFDSVCYSGCVDYGLMGKTGEAGRWRDRTIDGGVQEDILRSEVEKCVYGVLTRGRISRIMYVPIHIGGSPWISFFTFTPADDDSAWDDNYCFYRDIIAKLSDRIRSASQAIYIEALVDDLKHALRKNPNDIFNEIDDRWGAVSQIFPFRRHSLTQCSSATEGALSLPQGVHAILSEGDNPFCHGQIDYGHVGLERLKRTLSKELSLLEWIEHRASEGIRNRLTSQSHTFLNVLLSVTGSLDSALRANDVTTAQKYARDAASNTEILDASLRAALNRPLPADFPKDIHSMLTWMFDRTTSGGLKPELSLSHAQSTLPFTTTEEVLAAFTILWNLWDNAEKVAAGEDDGWFRVSTASTDVENRMWIKFTNLGKMSSPWILYLNDQGPSPNKENRKRGLEIVKELIVQLDWRLECQVGDKGITDIRLCLPRKLHSQQGLRR